MKTVVICLACLLILPLVACQEQTPSAPPNVSSSAELTDAGVDQMALSILNSTGWPAIDEDGNPVDTADGMIPGADKCLVISADRQMITDDIAHYSFIVRVGTGQYDLIGIHRVVKERRPFRPIRSRKAVFMQHGASTDFTYCFLPGLYSETTPDDFGIAVYLAESNVDVWGIDQRWTLIPPEETNVDYMATWDLPMHSNDIGVGIDLARLLRLLTGNGWDRMHLLGFSMGAEFSFGLVDGDSQRPPGQRRIKGFIPVDMVIQVPEDSPWRELMCSFVPYFEDQIANGVYGEGAAFRTVGILARDDPGGDSPVFPGMTNEEAAIAFGTTLIYGVPPFHLFAGEFEDDTPVGMQFISNEAWVEYLCSMSSLESNVAGLDQAHEICGDDVPWNQHWDDIRVPVFYVGARGGFGEACLYQLGFLGSDDVTTLMVSTNPDELLDTGHLDLFLGSNAEVLVWQPILEWIVDHSRGGHGRAQQGDLR